MNIHCKRATELISDSMHRPLTRYEKLGLFLHTMICSVCRRYRKQVSMIRNFMRENDATLSDVAEDPSLQLSDDARKRIAQAVRQRASM